jgi:hypothetical protein
MLKTQGFDVVDWDVFARTQAHSLCHTRIRSRTYARDKLDVPKQTWSVENFARPVLVSGS